jgi:GMP synthase (glutamine-hydrolysing)
LWSAPPAQRYNTGFARRECLPAFQHPAFRHSGIFMSHQTVLILDFGSQVTQLIARRVREAHVYSEIHPYDISDDAIRQMAPIGIILSGSHGSTYEDHQLRAPDAVWELGVPVLGICYGMHTMAAQLGGTVSWSDHREFGYAEVRAHA